MVLNALTVPKPLQFDVPFHLAQHGVLSRSDVPPAKGCPTNSSMPSFATEPVRSGIRKSSKRSSKFTKTFVRFRTNRDRDSRSQRALPCRIQGLLIRRNQQNLPVLPVDSLASHQLPMVRKTRGLSPFHTRCPVCYLPNWIRAASSPGQAALRREATNMQMSLRPPLVLLTIVWCLR